MKTILRYPLRKDPSFFKTARKAFSKQCVMYVKKSLTKTYYAVIVSKKLFPLATQRNYCKRKVKAALALAVDKQKPYIVVIIPKKTIYTASVDALGKELQSALYGL